MPPDEVSAAAAYLLTPEAVRDRCAAIHRAGEAGELAHFALHVERLHGAADAVAKLIRANHSDLSVPYHSRWRHFEVGGVDRWRALASILDDDPVERARVRVELAVTSVLLDAGAGTDWRYREPRSGDTFARSEGLALASFDAYAAGLFSADASVPLRADAAALQEIDTPRLAVAFQAGADNPLVGLQGRAALLHGLGRCLAAAPEVFAAGRLGHLLDHLLAVTADGRLPARTVLVTLLRLFAPIWPGRLALGGVNLGDVWRHPRAGGEGPSAGLVPLHKLSQWLAYSLIEPLEECGVAVTGLDDLTGLAEYRNGGLLVDTGVLAPRHDGVTGTAHAADSEVIVEWRALTVPLLDQLAALVRRRLGVSQAAFPLARVLEGGTWHAGRALARELRPDGAPPIRLASDGTVF